MRRLLFAAVPLTLAAVATAVGFSCFVPTAYRGLAELGQIAGCGMIIAFFTSITALPALLTVLNPPGEPHPMGFAALAPVDTFVQRYRVPVVVTTLVVVVLAAPLLWFLPFDFNPLHLDNPNVESVKTFLQLRKYPETGANAIEIMAPNLDAADAIASHVSSLPQVSQTETLSRLVPADRDPKIALIHNAAETVEPSLNPAKVMPAPTDQQNIDALRSAAATLSSIAGDAQGTGAEAARRLADLLGQLAAADPAVRQRVEAAVVEPLRLSLDQLREELQPQQITVNTIPADLKRQWVTEDGRARVEVLPKGDPDNTEILRNFVQAVLAVAPYATGPAVLLYEAYGFVIPALNPEEKRTAVPVMLVAPLLFLLGAAFAYVVILPPAVHFLQGYNGEQFNVLLQARSWYSFEIMTMLGVGLVFQLPLGLLALHRLGVMDGRTLTRHWRYAAVIIAVIGAAMPGADPVTTALETLPLVVLFLVSIVLLRLADRRAAATAEAEATQQFDQGLGLPS